ncbi:MAG TPA: EVE domain-containing protein [Kofleriaceae bacterium]
MPQFWLMKTEPETFSIDDLERVKVEPWTGVRSVFARFHMRAMSVGDEVLFYHSSCEPPGVAGLARVVKTRVIDETQFDPQSKYFDEKATREKPIWDCVEVEFVEKLPYFVSLAHIRAEPELKDMKLLQIGRLSVMPVAEPEFHHVVAMGRVEPKPLPEPIKVARPKRAKKPARAAKTARAKKPAKKSSKQPRSKR